MSKRSRRRKRHAAPKGSTRAKGDSEKITPQTDWQELSMLYTSTQTPNLRVHLHYFPGEGEIHVDKVTVEGLYT